MNPTNGVMGDIARVNTMNQQFGGRSVGGVPQAKPQQNGLLQSAQRFLKGVGSGSYVGPYNDKSVGVKSFGARLGSGKYGIAGNIGTSNGKLFGNANINGKDIGHFGPQGY